MRLVLVWRADPHGYAWMPPHAGRDRVVAFDDLAALDLRDRDAVRFDALQTWEDRSSGERTVSQAFEQFRDAELGRCGVDGYDLADFLEHSLRVDFANILRGWIAGEAAAGCTSIVADPACPAAVVIGAHAAAGRGPIGVRYAPAQSPTWQPSLPRRIVGRALVDVGAAVSPGADVRIAVATNYKVTAALAATPPDELRRLGAAAMPLPGFDPRDNLRLAARARLPVVRTAQPVSSRGHPGLPPTARPAISVGDARLDAAFSDVAARLAGFSWVQLGQAVRATKALERHRGLRAILMPTLFSGTPRVFTAWARRRGIKVGVVQHGVYAFRDFNGQDRGADVVLTWGATATAEPGAWWDGIPRTPVGIPGVGRAGHWPATASRVRRVLFATTGPSLESVLSPAALHDWFISAILPGAARLQANGISVGLRLHPSETPDRYERLMRHAGVHIPIAEHAAFLDAAVENDLLVSAFSSVALEASALGMPVLLWLPAMPADYVHEHFVPPWTERLPGVFHDEHGFEALARGLLGESPPALRGALDLAARLQAYARPFDAQAFLDALRELAD